MTALTTTERNPVLDTPILTEDLLIDSDTPGIQLHLRHKRAAGPHHFAAEKTLLLLHGATYASGSLFDVPLDGYSFLDFAAARGYDVYALDVRGYGASTRPPEMQLPAAGHPPLVRTPVAVQDLASAVDFICQHRNIQQLNLLAMSWGGSVAGAYTSQNNNRIRKLVLVAPLWITRQPVPIAAGGELGAYRVVPILSARERWLAAVPENRRDGFLPQGWFEQWAAAALADDVAADDTWNHNPASSPSVRAPSGAVQDIRDYWTAGKSLYNPGLISVPVHVIHGEWDTDVTIDTTQDLFRALTGSAERRWTEIAEATHMLLLERNRLRAMRAALSFLDED